ncbi:hypothetical protein DKU95_25030 [Salmonella enterica subsp. enterica serovar Montevideo]|uniref:Uncharacterized protein n=1 Tax=Salmonella montevideo TaxID=115981 RepID=A0A3V2EXP6_SALMO|nr:hypothetical protein [Salmonella enterica subsp. enterica serovar Montevideo]EBQ8889887.1 hypothetical protein [Salmonella enterica subsp. enterica serovar Montevideo]EBS0514798.1 hypothetical protein [Salmonella enterica subsp. enterica serovar Montevideo]EBS4622339.1 hypothetical protein [Salmonella enterica subsp. enterica serovar Montevideo]EBX9074878.1 hypothetical protein [Salmonella enterica subsp. enterica serovar Montevideo]
MLGSKKGLLEQIYSFSVFPAPAGINRSRCERKAWRTGVPRASGDKPRARQGGKGYPGCSPRQRG